MMAGADRVMGQSARRHACAGLPAVLDNSASQTTAFKLLSGTSALLAAVALLFPDQLLDVALPAGDTREHT